MFFVHSTHPIFFALESEPILEMFSSNFQNPSEPLCRSRRLERTEDGETPVRMVKLKTRGAR